MSAVYPMIIVCAQTSRESRQMGAPGLARWSNLTKLFNPEELVHRVNSLVASLSPATNLCRRSA